MALIICPECGKKFSDKAIACPECGCPIEYILNNQNIDNNNTASMSVSERNSVQAVTTSGHEIQSTASPSEVTGAKLRNYLKAVYDLLLEINTLDNVFNTIKNVKFQKPVRRSVSEPRKPKTAFEFTGSISMLPGITLKARSEMIYAHCLQIIDKAKSYGVPISDKCYSIIPLVCLPACADLEKKIYEEYELPDYYKQLELAEEQYKSDVATLNVSAKYAYDQLTKIVEEKKAATASLDKLYSLDIIAAKYRSLLPVACFYQYAETGRRDRLGGINGMYDLFEDEYRKGLIISNLSGINTSLSEISQHLGDIKLNQQELHYEIQKSNEVAAEINGSINKVLQRIKTLDNTASNIDKTLSSMNEARKVQDLLTDMAYMRMNHIDKILSTNYSDH